jgi:2-polyprenyl-3-methyl-5-hydroxy-6-metoxy-1,4-benzoquinol methylase
MTSRVYPSKTSFENTQSLDRRKENSRSAVSSACPGCGALESKHLLSAPDRYHGRRQLFHLVQCTRCTLVWQEGAPGPEEIGKHYGPLYDRAIAAAGENSPGRWRHRIDTLRQYRQSGAILDLGCSAGSFLSELGPGWELNGIEMSPVPAAMAQRLCGANIFVGDILDAQFAPGSFDVITCFHVFEHLYQPKLVLEKVSQWLKPGGIFYVMVPNIDSAGARIFRSYWYALELPRHLFHFSPRSLGYLAQSAGLEVASLTTYREVFIESSTHYIVDEWARKLGWSRRSLAETPTPSIPYRAVRKLFRLTVLPVLNGLASVAGDGESIHAMFRKRVEE